MGITIDDVREELISILTEIKMTGGSMVTSIYKDELKMAIETLRKYQKIKNIICKWEDGLFDDEGVLDAEVLEMISDEVEDGKID